MDPVSRYIILEGTYDAGLVTELLEAHLDGCSGNNWIEVCAQVPKIGIWEFEGYASGATARL